MPAISVVIPAHNSGRYLDEAVRSVIAQTFTDWECVVVDDGSSEDLSRVIKMDSRVRLIRQENRGISMSRNRGIAESTGEFIAFLDHDDLFLPTKLERQVATMRSDPQIGLCHTDYAVMDSAGHFDLKPSSPNPATDFLTMLKFGAPLPTNTIVRRSALQLVGLFDPFLTPSEDQDLFIRIGRYFKIAFIPSCEALYRVHGANTSKNYMICYRTMKNLADRHIINARYRRDAAALAAAKAMMPYRRKKFFGPQAYDAARLCLQPKGIAGLAMHLSRALRWSPAYTLGAIAKFPVQQLKKQRTRPPETRTKEN